MTTPANLPDAMRARRDAGQALLDAVVAEEAARRAYAASDDGDVGAVMKAARAVDDSMGAYISAVDAEIALAREPVAEGA